MRNNDFMKHFITIAFIGFMIANVNAQQHFTEFEFTETATANMRQTMQKNATAIFKQIHESYHNKKQTISLSHNNATKNAIERIQALWSTSKFYCIETDLIARILEMSNGKGFQVRNIPVFFVDGATDEDKYQDMVLEFDTEGKISDLYISLPMNQYYKIFESGNGVTDLRRRQLVLGFVENVRTAYNRKDAKYLDQVFSNDALIITGKVLKRAGDSPNPVGVDVKYVTQSKVQYLKKLKTVFTNNAFINIKFDEIEVLKDEENENIYGVTLRQHWNTSSYSDEGWLFLMIDFRNEDEPQICVRTWQSLDVPRSKVFGLVDFSQ